MADGIEQMGRTEQVKNVTTDVFTVVNTLYVLVDISRVRTRPCVRSSEAHTKPAGETYRFRGSRWRVGCMRGE